MYSEVVYIFFLQFEANIPIKAYLFQLIYLCKFSNCLRSHKTFSYFERLYLVDKKNAVY